jgi:hypothetical protein
MGTSSSGAGAKGKTPLLPNWATNPAPAKPDESDADKTPEKEKGEKDEKPDKTERPKKEYTGDWGPAKAAFTRYARKGGGRANFSKAASSYVRSMGGSSNALRSAARGVSVGANYVEFLGSIGKQGLERTLQDFGLTDCIGKSPEEALAMLAQKIAPAGTTNDDILARNAVMAAIDSLYLKLEEKGDTFEAITNVSEENLKETVIEFVGAYIFKKWIYELGIALERNELSEQEAIDLETEVKVLVKDEVKLSLRDKNILKLDFEKGDGKRIIENIFELAYSTLEK